MKLIKRPATSTMGWLWEVLAAAGGIEAEKWKASRKVQHSVIYRQYGYKLRRLKRVDPKNCLNQ